MTIALSLFSAFTLREINSRYRGSVLGLGWVFISPAAMLMIYAFVFGAILKSNSANLGTSSYTMFLGAALWPWMMFSDGIVRGMGAIKANASLVRKVAFPHAVLVYAAVGAATALHMIGYVVIMCILALIYGGIAASGIPGVLLSLTTLLIFTVGIALLLAALQTLLPDVEQAVQPLLMMLYFLTPVLYPQSAIPDPYREWFNWNPLALIIGRLRDHLFGNTSLALIDLLIFVMAVAAFGLCHSIFKRLSPHFEDFV